MQTQTLTEPADVLAGLTTRPAIAKALDCSERTIIRREAAGMPVIRIGAARLYDLAAVRAWIMRHECRHDTPKRGRPRKSAA